LFFLYPYPPPNPQMNEYNLEVENQTCRWCNIYDSSKVGMKVCDCDGACGYAHNKCFFAYVRQTARRRCDYCNKSWSVDKQLWQHYITLHKRVAICNRVREAASILLTLLVVLSMILIWAEGIKFAFWIIYASPKYIVFGIPVLASNAWLTISVGDIVAGSIGTVATILLAVLWVHYKTKCFRCCCGNRRYGEYTQELDMQMPSGRRAMDTLIASQSRSGRPNHRSDSAVLLERMTEDNYTDDDDVSLSRSGDSFSEDGDTVRLVPLSSAPADDRAQNVV